MIALSNATGAVLERIGYDAYGQPEFRDASGVRMAQSITGNRFLYTGREWFDSLSLQDNRNRYYQPNIGRWLSRDPIGERGGLSLHGYVGNNPIMKMEPTGLKCSRECNTDSNRCMDKADRKEEKAMAAIDAAIKAIFESADDAGSRAANKVCGRLSGVQFIACSKIVKAAVESATIAVAVI